MPSFGMRALVPPITSEPLPYGLLGGCVPVVDADPHELNGTDMQSSGCGVVTGWQDCPADDPITGPYVNPATKDASGIRLCTFEPFTAVSGIECSAFGIDYEDAQDRALEQLRMGEQTAFEDFFMRRGLARFAMGEDLTPAEGALSICMGVGLLETWLAGLNAGVGVIHAPVGVGTLLSGNRIVDFPGDGERCLETLVGNKVVLGGGYSANVGPYTAPLTPGTVAPAGEAWIYATPAMRIRRSARELVQDAEWQTMNTSVNDRRVFAESTFVAEVSCCFAAAVRVNLSC